jgi:hypothetical protein
MSINPLSSWITSGTPDYISRQEVVYAFSTLAGDLSGVDLSGLIIQSPNPRFSTIQMPPNGSISNPGNIVANSALGVSSVFMTYNRPYPTGISPNFMLGIRDNIVGTNYSALAVGAVLAKGQIFTNAISQYVNPTQSGYFDANSNAVPVTNFNPALNQVALSNISSINGNPPSGGTTFTTLTGNTLNATTVNTTNLLNVTNFNGLTKIAPYSAPFNITGLAGINNNTPTVVGTISLPFNLTANGQVAVSIPLRIGGFAPGSPAVYYGAFGVRVGGAVGPIAYLTPIAINTNLTSGFQNIMVSGIAQVAATGVTNTIDIIAIQQTGSNITCQIANSPGGFNYLVNVLV